MLRSLLAFILFLSLALPIFAQSVDTAWVRRYNGPGNGQDVASAVAVDGSGNVYVTGYSWVSETDHDYVTIKYLPNGDTAWVRSYNGPGNAYDEARALAVDGSGNVYVTGRSDDSLLSEDYATIKYLPNGDTAWVRRYNGPGNGGDIAYALALEGPGNIYVTGYSWGSGTDLDYATIKYHPNGDTAWVRRYNGPGNMADVACAVVVDGSGNINVTGTSEDPNPDYATIKYYPNGDTAWVRRYKGPVGAYEEAYALAADGSGNVYVTGKSEDTAAGRVYATIKYYSNGDTAWLRTYDGAGTGDEYDIAFDIAVDVSGNVYVTGYTTESGTFRDYTTIKYHSNGDTAWVRSYNGPGNSYDGAFSIAVDGSGNVYVTGSSPGIGTSTDYATIKYYPNGDTAWVARYNGTGSMDDEARAIALDNSGNVYVTGYSSGSGTDADYATIKYTSFQSINDTLQFFAYSPVDIIVTDPSGDSIGVDFNSIPNATYDTTTDKNNDGDKDDIVTIPNPLVGSYLVRIIAEPGADTGHYTEAVKLDGNEEHVMILNASVPPQGHADTVVYSVVSYLRGDVNGDGKKTVSDVVFLINYLFKGGPAPNPVYLGDVNCDGKNTVSDVVWMINYLFKGGNAPCS